MGQRLEVASSGYGTVFAINTNGTGFTNLVGSVGSFGGLILSGDTLYGTAPTGGSSDNGRVFAVSTSGTGFTNMHSLTATDNNTGTNIDGSHPYCGLILSGNTLYGTIQSGISTAGGTVFAVSTNGTSFRTLHIFTFTDGAYLEGGLILSGNTLYGTASYASISGQGTVFSIFIRPQL